MALLTPELLRRLEQFQLLAARRSKSSAKGERRSKARGQSVEFADFRSYVAGDDFRPRTERNPPRAAISALRAAASTLDAAGSGCGKM